MTLPYIAELHGKHNSFAAFTGRFFGKWHPEDSVTTELIRLSHMVIQHVAGFCRSNAFDDSWNLEWHSHTVNQWLSDSVIQGLSNLLIP